MSQPPADRRAHPRQGASGDLRLVTRSGHVLNADLVDRSLKGMRVRLDDAGLLPSEISVLWLTGATVYEARVVWRTPPLAGLAITGSVDMRAPAQPGTAAAHKLWRDHAGR